MTPPRLSFALALLLVAGTASAQTTAAPVETPTPSASEASLDSQAPASEPVPADTASVEPQAATDATPQQDVVAPTTTTTDTPTAAEQSAVEQDDQALEGDQVEPAVELPTPAELPTSYDPWEGFNRRMHRFNDVVDRRIAKPLAKAYVAVVPRPVRLGVSNFFSNLGQPVSALNSLLQGKPKQAAQAFGRFALNSTLGLAGIFDPATDAKLPHRSEDFGQTLGVWGWKRSRYVELPLFGPRTVRDVFGMVGDAPLAPIRGIEEDKARVFLQGLQLVDVRTQLLSVDSMREGANDDYALLRDAWLQRRNYQIFGDRQLEGDDNLPDYLREDENPIVPADAMPVMPTDVN